MLHEHRSITQVGSPDPELRNSPIAVEEDIDTDVVRQQVPGAAVCWFNGTEFRDGGSQNRTTAPSSPSVRLAASSVPPCASTISRHRVRPSPLPAGLVE